MANSEIYTPNYIHTQLMFFFLLYTLNIIERTIVIQQTNIRLSKWQSFTYKCDARQTTEKPYSTQSWAMM